MKTIFTIFFLWIFHFNCTAQWAELNVGDFNTYHFSDIYAITPNDVIVTGWNGLIIKSTDGGLTWQQKASGTTANLKNVQFPTSSIGYVTAADGKLRKTTDGGEIWSTIDIGQSLIILSLSCMNENLIYILALDSDSHYILLKSTNGGITWETINENLPQAQLYDIKFFNNETGYAASYGYPDYDHKILKTQDGGKNWMQMQNSSLPFSFISENTGFYYLGGLFKTTNAGGSFSKLTEGSWSIRNMYAVDESNVWGILDPALNGDSSTQGIRKISSSNSEAYSETTVFENNPQIDMTAIHFANETTGYILGIKNGKSTIWKNGTGINSPGVLGILDEDITSFKIYPNPTSDKINITINDQYSKEFTITLSDMSGKQVHNQNYNNKKEISVDVRNFAKGTYILTIKNQKQKYSQKIIIK